MFLVQFSWRLLRSHRLAVLVVVLAVAVQTGFRVLVPVGFQRVFDRAIGERDLEYLFELLGVMFLLWLIQTGASLVHDSVSARTGVAAVNALRQRMYERLARISDGFLAQRSTGDLLIRFSIDLGTIEAAVVRSMSTFLFSTRTSR